jgi:hypothetical protein
VFIGGWVLRPGVWSPWLWADLAEVRGEPGCFVPSVDCACRVLGRKEGLVAIEREGELSAGAGPATRYRSAESPVDRAVKMTTDNRFDLSMLREHSRELIGSDECFVVHPVDAGDEGRVVLKDDRWSVWSIGKCLVEPLELMLLEASSSLPGDGSVETDEPDGEVIDDVVDGFLCAPGRNDGLEERAEQCSVIVIAGNR